MNSSAVWLNQPERRLQEHCFSASGRPEQYPGIAGRHGERDIIQRRFVVVERNGDMLESQRKCGRLLPHQVSTRLTKIWVMKNVRMKMRTEAITTACVVARPTPCVPP